LAPLRARGASQDEQDALIERARAFYAQRQAQAAPAQPAAPAEDEPAYPSSFARLAELIATGAPIPGIKHVPDVINDAAPTEPQLAGKVTGAGRKPWETAAADATPGDSDRAANSSTIEHVFGSVDTPSHQPTA